MDDATLERFADVIVGFGANVQPGQIVSISCEPGKEFMVRAIAASAYRHGAKFVDVQYFDPWVKRARVEHAREEDLDFIPDWHGKRLLALGEVGAARVGLSGPVAPGLLEDLDPARVGRDRFPALKEAGKVVNDRTTNWTIAPCPTPAWAHARLPRPRRPTRRSRSSSRDLLHVCRLDEDDPVAAWRSRADFLVATAERLTERRFDALHYEGPGTDLTVGLLPGHVLAGRALRARRRARAHAEPADRGGLHLARPGARRRRGHVHQAARADGRDRRARAARPLRGRQGRADRRRHRGRDAAHDLRARRGRRPASARSRSSTPRAASARSTPSSTTRCSTRTPPATSRSARASRS